MRCRAIFVLCCRLCTRFSVKHDEITSLDPFVREPVWMTHKIRYLTILSVCAVEC